MTRGCAPFDPSEHSETHEHHDSQNGTGNHDPPPSATRPSVGYPSNSALSPSSNVVGGPYARATEATAQSIYEERIGPARAALDFRSELTGSVDVFAGRVHRAYILGSEEPPPLDL